MNKFALWFWTSALLLLSGAIPLLAHGYFHIGSPSLIEAGIRFGMGMLFLSALLSPLLGLLLLFDSVKTKPESTEDD